MMFECAVLSFRHFFNFVKLFLILLCSLPFILPPPDRTCPQVQGRSQSGGLLFRCGYRLSGSITQGASR